MAIFPRKGVELSADAEMLFDDVTYDLPAVRVEFENGTEEVSARFPTGRYRFTVRGKVHEDDWMILVAFLLARQIGVEPFTIHHPFLTGTDGATVRYVGDSISFQRVVRGNPSWFEFSFEFRGQL